MTMLLRPFIFIVIALITFGSSYTRAAYPVYATSVNKTVSVSTDTVYIKQTVKDSHSSAGKTAKTFGILSLALFFYAGGIFFGIPAIAIGATHMKEDRNAKTGFICGVIGLGLTLAIVVAYLISEGVITF